VFLCVCVLTDVDAVIVLTQTPAVHTVSTGQEVVLNCNIQRYDNKYVYWYKQVPGAAPQYILRFYHSHSSPTFGTGFSSDRFNSKSSSDIDYHGVTVVTQKPPVVTLRKGETATMDCNLGTVTDSAARWYKQTPGGVPQYILRFYHTNSAPTYGSGFSSPKFTSNHQSTSDYRLIINNVEEGDSAVYYCQTWDDSAKEHVSQ
uniref:Ig-like domain-containing protein n=1 Tax=Seriola lalandi dorsalis TaxID=1841481 RepID=A0A3B4YHK1_SERLL